jgi:hypothetical protein
MSNREAEYTGSVVAVREVEDCIRATRKYAERIGTMRKHHPIQGEDIPSKVFCKYYEVYPEMEVSLDMRIEDAVIWLSGETPCFEVKFNYDYRDNKALVNFTDGLNALRDLKKSIPNLSECLAKVGANGNNH